jgi:signal peptidase I
MTVKIEKERTQKNSLSVFFNWLWNSESWLSYLVFLILVFIFVKFIFLPGLGLIFGTQLPLAIVESSSMEHYALETDGLSGVSICGQSFSETQFLDKEKYWSTCGEWYEKNTNITKEEFQNFKLSNGFRKGDLMIIFGKKNIEIGDIIIFDGGRNHPIIHRVISLNPIQTKGDHNPAQLALETNINKNQIVGTAVARIPYIGWIKLFFVELFK